MTNEEKNIKQILGNEHHFRVPEGYFDTLSDQIMAKIPGQEPNAIDEEAFSSAQSPMARKVSLLKRLPLRKIAAGIAIAFLVGSGVTFGLLHTGGKSATETHAEACQIAHMEKVTRHAASATSDDAEFNQMADYAMMDNQDIYASLIAEN